MGNEYQFQQQQQQFHKAKLHKQRNAQDPLLRELSALSRAPSLRDPSTSSIWKASLPSREAAAAPNRRREREARGNFAKSTVQEEELEEMEEEDEQAEGELRTGWQDKVVNWIDGGLREGERKQELLRSISDLLNSKVDAPVVDNRSAAPKQRKTGSMENHKTVQNRRDEHTRKSLKETDANNNNHNNRKTGRIAWKEDDVEWSYGGAEQNEHQLAKALALTRHSKMTTTRNDADPGYDHDESNSSSGDETDGFVSQSQSPLLGMQNKDRRIRRGRKVANGNPGCANFRFSIPSSHPYKTLVKSGSENLDGPEATHGCGLPWSYWSRQKGKNLLEMAGRSLSCGYADITRREVLTGQEIIPVPAFASDPNGKRHRSLSQKYRPKTFREMVGQNMLVQALSNAVTRGRIAPVYLFHGPRGTGKTSAAKILAAALNCVSVEDARPCGVCRECLLLCLGKTTDVKEVDVASHDATILMKKLLHDVAMAPSGRYKVFIIDECHTMTAEGWNLFIKCLEEPPEYAVFILTTTDAEQVPHPALTRCQKFHFPKIKDSDIVSRLQKLAAKEMLEAETDALELIAGRSNGSLRDAETTLDQLSLVGQRITLEVVQELVGLVCNAKLAELLDMALVGDTLNTVKCVREFMDAGVEPLALMSQMATLITDILAGGYMPASDKGFFQKRMLTKDQLEKLRKALKTLSESEKQIRSSQDQTTWLTAALLQFAPDTHSGFPVSSAGTSGTPSVLAANDTSEKETIEWEPTQTKPSWDDFEHHQTLSGQLQSMQQLEAEKNNLFQEPRAQYPAPDVVLERQQKLADTWIRVLEVSQSNILKQLLWNHGRLLTITIEGGRAVAYLEFQQPEHRSSAERSKTSISHAFQLVLGFPVEIRLRLTGDSKPNFDEQKHHHPSGPTESKAPPSPAKSGGQAEYLNSRSFPVFIGRVKGGGEDEFSHDEKGSWEHVAEEKSCSSENQSEVCAVHGGGRQMFQVQGRRFKLKTVRNFSTDEGGRQAAAAAIPEGNKNQRSGSRQKHGGGGGGSLLCWKANRVDEDDEDEDATEISAM